MGGEHGSRGQTRRSMIGKELPEAVQQVTGIAGVLQSRKERAPSG
jgi:hypothetical protein